DRLNPCIEEAIQALSDYGNPSSQVKMLWASQYISGIDLLKVIKRPLNSNIEWVRSQALIVVPAHHRDQQKVGLDVGTELAYDLANGMFLKRFFAYLKAVKSARGFATWWCLFVGLVATLCNLAVLGAGAGVSVYLGLLTPKGNGFKFSRSLNETLDL